MRTRNLCFRLSIVLTIFLISACMLISSNTESPTLTPSLAATLITPELPTQTHTPAPTATKPLPTFTPTAPPPTSSPTPTPIEGIDVPIVIKDVSLKNSIGFTEIVDIQMRILDAITRESLESGTKPILPKEKGDVFLTLKLAFEGFVDAVDWLALNAPLICNQETYKATGTGLEVREGVVYSWNVNYQIPGVTSFGECSLQLPDGREVSLGRFFGSPNLAVRPTATQKLPAFAPTLTPEPGRVYEAEGGFSYVPPEGWKVTQAPGFDYKVILGIQTGDFVPNLFFYVNNAHSGSLDEYVTGSLEHNQTILENLKIVSQEDFLTDEGKRGVKVIDENTQRNMRMRQTSYYFEAGARKFVATYTRLADKGQSNDVLIDQSMKTFRPEAIPGESPGTPEETTAPSKQVILIANPNCPAPKITSADEIIVRVRWGATTAEVAESNADHFTFTFLVDGEDKGDIRPYRQPAETYSGQERYGCGSGSELGWVHWDVPIGQLSPGMHTVSVNYILDQKISDGIEEYSAGQSGFYEVTFEVLP